MKQGLIAMAVAGLAAGLAGCGASADPGAAKPEASATTPSSTPVPTHEQPKPTTTPATKPTTRPGASAQTKAVVNIKSFRFAVPVSVAPGSTVSVKNQDGEKHTVTSVPKGFDTEANGGGGTSTFKAPAKPGSYKFVCSLHGGMTGTLVVK